MATLNRTVFATPTSTTSSATNALPRWLSWHRRPGLMAVTGVVLWCASGVLHPIMTRLQPDPARQQLDLSVPDLDAALDPVPRLRALGADNIVDLRVIRLDGQAAYQVTLPGQAERLVLRARDLDVVPGGDRRYAESLARLFADEEGAAVRRAELITEPGYEYSYVNRLLPVWRIEFDRPDHLRVFVDTRTGRLGTLVDDRHGAAVVAFSVLHRWLWLQRLSPPLRLAVLGALALSAIVTALMGLWIYWLRWRVAAGRWGLRRAHRITGLCLSVMALTFPLSGGGHLFYDGIEGDAAARHPVPDELIKIERLAVTPPQAARRAGAAVSGVSIARVGDQIGYRVQRTRTDVAAAASGATAHEHGAHMPSGRVTPGSAADRGPVAWVSAADGRIVPGGEEAFLRARARQAIPNEQVGEIRLITHFDNEYGFVFKRLPVWRVAFSHGVGVFVDPADGAIAAVTNSADRAEQWFFAHVHKFEWLVPWVGVGRRDAIAMGLAALLGVTAVLGAVLALRRRRHS